jgi:hypothetical protein
VAGLKRSQKEMKEFRITKYNPENRDASGAYLDHGEWTSFTEVGTKLSEKEYQAVESNYIEAAIDLVSDQKQKELTVVSLEDHNGKSMLAEGSKIEGTQIERVLRSLLREEFWCRLESEEAFIHIGWNYYMYVGVSEVREETQERILNRGLYVEDFISPYHPDECEPVGI